MMVGAYPLGAAAGGAVARSGQYQVGVYDEEKLSEIVEKIVDLVGLRIFASTNSVSPLINSRMIRRR